MNSFALGLTRYWDADSLHTLAGVRVGFAGCGGLGSNGAMLLARSGLEHFVLVDDDVVDASNLNRQHFFPAHLGRFKVDALAEQLRDLNPAIEVCCYPCRLTEQTLPEMLSKAEVWVEALDDAGMKCRFVEACLAASRFVVSASGIAGFGGPPMRQKVLGQKLVLVGDFTTDIAHAPPLAPRVMQAAALQADAVLAYILRPPE
ncbi:MAG: sulfur carrier protein ThiS adenylyltransferase ThiF [Desulfovibrionaceae bacterium]